MRRYLIPIALLAGIIGVYLSFGATKAVVSTLSEGETQLIVAVAGAIALQLLGHLLRAKRTKLILDQASPSSDAFQFGTLSVGYLFNALLPFRIGEVVRSVLIARRLRISFLYTFTSVVIERAIDVIFLGLLILAAVLFIGGSLAIKIIFFTAGVMTLAIVILLGVVLLMREDKRLLAVAWRMTGWFNASISNSLRFKVWSLIFGLQHFYKNRHLVRRYGLLSAASWLLYATSLWMVSSALLVDLDIVGRFVSSIAPYVISIPTWNIQQPDSYAQYALFLPGQSPENLLIFGLLTWAVLVFPMASIGLLVLFALRIAPVAKLETEDPDAFANKLLRHSDISQAFPAFLDSYFSGNQMAKILHKLEADNQLRLVRYFKGGSDAITVLVLSEKDLFVKKIIPKRYQDRLQAQHDWLKRHAKLDILVKVQSEQESDEYYAIDLAYDPENIPLFEYIHHTSVNQSKLIVERTWRSLHKHLYKSVKTPVFDANARDAFIAKHIEGCIEVASQASPDLEAALKPDTIIINGKEYDNYHRVMERLRNHPQAYRDIATYSHAEEVHGDMAIDNVLVSSRTNEPLIIDPAPDGNIINGPVFDLGKMSQSFYCGYEFLFRDNEAVELSGDNNINYREHMSDRYSKLWQYLRFDLAPKYLSDAELNSMLFHAATLHLRVLKHRVYINPDNVLKFYAVGIKTLNDFLDQYETK